MVMSNGQSTSVTPSSAMSISPATSEVGSIKSNLSRPNLAMKLERALGGSSSSRRNGGGSSSSLAGSPGGKHKSHYWGAGKTSSRDGPDRSDRDMNWRRAAANGLTATGGGDSPAGQGSQWRAAAGPVGSGGDPDRADRDTNWRNHREPDKSQAGKSGKSVRSDGGKGKKEGMTKSSAAKDGKSKLSNTPPKQKSPSPPPSNSAPSPSPLSTSSSAQTAKERLTAGLTGLMVAEERGNSSREVDNVRNNNTCESPVDNADHQQQQHARQDNQKRPPSKKKQRKSKRKANNSEEGASSSSSSASTTPSASNGKGRQQQQNQQRFSCRTGLDSPDR